MKPWDRPAPGGATLRRISENVHVDHHAIVIDPADPERRHLVRVIEVEETEDLVFQETGDRQNFQGRYVIRHPFRGELTCDANQYLTEVRNRQDREAETLANLTGWDIDDVRSRIDFPGIATNEPDREPWWKRLWQ